eukprot:gene31984-32305_t
MFLLATEYELQMRYPGLLAPAPGSEPHRRGRLKGCSGFVSRFPSSEYG